MRELGPIGAAAPEFPLATSGIAPLRAKAEAQGSGDFSPLWSGQNATGCREVVPRLPRRHARARPGLLQSRAP
jgi:nitronate monooxygenase